jgi:hypothetical protein
MLIFDIETDGLLRDVTQIHCLVIHDTDTEQTMVFNDQLLIMILASSINFIHGLDVLVIAWILFCLAVFITRT